MDKSNIKFVLVQILIAAFMLVIIMARSKGLNPVFFWPVIWLLIIFSFIMVYKLPPGYKVASIIILSVAISAIQLVALPEIYYMERDSVFESQYASTIIDAGRWDPSLGEGFAKDFYGYNPVLHFALSFASLATGLSPFILLRYFFFILIRALIPCLALLILSHFVKSRESNLPYIATLFFVGMPGMAFIGVTRRSISSIFVMLALFAMINSGEPKRKMLWEYLFMAFSFMVVLSNHSISLYFLLFLIGAFLFSKFISVKSKRRVKEPFYGISFKLFYFIFILFLWNAFSKWIFIETNLGYIAQIAGTLFKVRGIGSFIDVGEAGAATIIYHSYETLLIYSAQFILILFAFLGLFFYFKKFIFHWDQRLRKGLQIIYMGIFSLFIFFISALLIRGEMSVAVIIFLWFPCIFLSFFIAYFFDTAVRRSSMKKLYLPIIITVLVYLFSASLMMGIYTPRITNRAPDEDIVIGLDKRSKSEELFHSAEWLYETSGSNNNLLTDIDSYEIFSGFFSFPSNVYESSLRKVYSGDKSEIRYMLLSDKIDFGIPRHTITEGRLDYIIINKAFFDYPSITFGSPLKKESIAQLSKIELLDKVYSNDKVGIYRIERWE